MQSAVVLAETFMSQYEDRLPLSLICDEILAVLADGGVRIGDPVPEDLADEARQRLELAVTARIPLQASGGGERRTAVITPAG